MAKQQDIPALTGLRGVAACWVVAYHVHEQSPMSGPLATLLKHGYLAVDVFFVLSGFVMALTYQGLFASGFRLRAYGVFLLRRLARIYPLYLAVTVAIMGLIALHHAAGFTWSGFAVRAADNIGLVDAWGPGDALDGPSWSVSTEMAAYLLFPALIWPTLVARNGWAVVVGACCLGGVTLMATLPTPPQWLGQRQGPLDLFWGGTAWPLLRCIAEFTAGLLAYRAAQDPPMQEICARPATATALAAALAALLLIPGTDVVFVTLAVPFLLCLAAGTSGVARAFASPPALLLGRLSYAIYLIHFPLIPPVHRAGLAVFGRTLAPGAAEVAALVFSYATVLLSAWVCWHAIERPGRQAIRMLERRLFPDEDARLRATA